MEFDAIIGTKNRLTVPKPLPVRKGIKYRVKLTPVGQIDDSKVSCIQCGFDVSKLLAYKSDSEDDNWVCIKCLFGDHMKDYHVTG